MSYKVFSPRKSYGWIFLSFLIFPFLILGGFTAYMYLSTGIIFMLITALMMVGLAIPFLVILISLPSMTYLLDKEKITIKCGFLKYKVPYNSIKKIAKRDLAPSLMSSFRFPGLALFKVLYSDVGTVKMCATSGANNILLIETDDGLYGITPKDEKNFIEEIQKRTNT